MCNDETGEEAAKRASICLADPTTKHVGIAGRVRRDLPKQFEQAGRGWDRWISS
jgi:hypothetical protein